MGKPAPWKIVWDNHDGYYRLEEHTAFGTTSISIESDTNLWKDQLNRAVSFSFHSKNHEHFTARKEGRARGGGYWTAYRKIDGKLKRKYLGSLQELTLARFEEIANSLIRNESRTYSHSNSTYKALPSTASLAPLTGRLQEPLFNTKLMMPPPARSAIVRARLEALLSEGIEYPLTLVSAPPGFGKTSLLQHWASALPSEQFKVAWVSLDDTDNNIVRFWTYLLSALDQCEPGLSYEALALLQAPQAPAVEYVLSTLISALTLTMNQLILVLDDYQVINEPSIHATLDYLLEHQSDHLRLILLTRNDPPLKLFRLRAHGKLYEIRVDDLRCNVEEMNQFMNQVTGIQLPENVLSQVVERTEGWLVGLQLLGLSMRSQPNPAKLLDAFNGTQRHILDYLTKEVLGQQTDTVQEFLLCTSILDPLGSALCNAVMEKTNSQAILEDLHQANMFVSSLDHQHHWYRYHTLFAEALRFQLERTYPSLVEKLHRRASRWYAMQNQTSEAIQHALKGQDWDYAADLIDSAAWLLLSSKGKMLWNWLQQLPHHIISARPRLCQLNISLINRVGPLKEAEPWLEALEKLAFFTPTKREETALAPLIFSESERKQMLGQITASRALITAYYGDGVRAAVLCQQAHTYLSETNLFEQALVATAQATIAEGAGQAITATGELLEASRLHQATGNLADAVLNMASAAVFLHLQA